MAHIKFTSHGTGGGGSAIDYLLDEYDHKGVLRADVQVLRGNPRQVGQLIDSLQFVCRYRSAVIAFHKDDDPTPDEISASLDDFERLSFAGLEPNQYTWTAILHVGKDGTKHIHAIMPRVELTSGKSFNVAPPGWQTAFDALRDSWNNERGWARPDDPNRQRLIQPGHTALIKGLSAEHTKEFLTQYLKQKVSDGIINDRADLIKVLSEMGEITRQGKDYISIKPDGHVKAIRLKGALFNEQFNASEWIENSAKLANATGRESITEEHRIRAIEARAVLESAIERRSEYNRGRYKSNERSPDIDVLEKPIQMQIQEQEQEQILIKKIKEGILNDSTGNIAITAAQGIIRAISFSSRAINAAIGRLNKTISGFANAIERIAETIDTRKRDRAAAVDEEQRNLYLGTANFASLSKLSERESDLDAGVKRSQQTGKMAEEKQFESRLFIDTTGDIRRHQQTFIDHRLQQVRAAAQTDLERATRRPEDDNNDNNDLQKQ